VTEDRKQPTQPLRLTLDGRSVALDGAQLAGMSVRQWNDAARPCNVFARVAPEHKLKLVRSLQPGGQIVALTGDGVNDGPALKQANIGVAMGITGTGAAKESAAIVVADDNFAAIAAAAEEGRRVYDNLAKSLAFVLPTNLELPVIRLENWLPRRRAPAGGLTAEVKHDGCVA